VGKTIATGLLANYLKKNRINVITQKMVQTGCQDISDDIKTHRQLMGSKWLPEDEAQLTCPYLFKHPASPHLSASLEDKEIDCHTITKATQTLSDRYECVIIEAAGGLLVPLNEKRTVLDHIVSGNYPVILVSSAKLGSINHTLLSIEALKNRRLDLLGIVYNHNPGNDVIIAKDSVKQIARFMTQYGYAPNIVEIDTIDILKDLFEITRVMQKQQFFQYRSWLVPRHLFLQSKMEWSWIGLVLVVHSPHSVLLNIQMGSGSFRQTRSRAYFSGTSWDSLKQLVQGIENDLADRVNPKWLNFGLGN